MKLDHTPGPWIVERGMDKKPYVISYNDDTIIAYPVFSLDTIGHLEANARLISAAPDMVDDYINIEKLIIGVKLGTLMPEVALSMIKIIADGKIERATGKKIEEVLK